MLVGGASRLPATLEGDNMDDNVKKFKQILDECVEKSLKAMELEESKKESLLKKFKKVLG